MKPKIEITLANVNLVEDWEEWEEAGHNPSEAIEKLKTMLKEQLGKDYPNHEFEINDSWEIPRANFGGVGDDADFLSDLNFDVECIWDEWLGSF